MNRLQCFVRGEDGATAVEYAVMLALILIVCIGAITLVGGGTFNYWLNNQNQLESAFTAS
jgi:pilus assembly protein Flp/PilA